MLCGNKPCACDDGKDNDGDGLVDGLDPECTGPYDDDEASFATSKVRGKPLVCIDCFFDGNQSHEDDGCRYARGCLSDGISGGPPVCPSCDVTAECVSFCEPRTPNGCDCFGCCEVHQKDGTRVNVELVDTCSMAKLGDEKACPRCVQNTLCRNACGPCELCPGRTAADLDPTCTQGGAGPTCDEGQMRCDEHTPCPLDYYCQLGCCLPSVL